VKTVDFAGSKEQVFGRLRAGCPGLWRSRADTVASRARWLASWQASGML